MKKLREFTRVRYEIVLDNMTVRGGDWATEEAAMKAVPTMERVFNGKFVRLNRHEMPAYEIIEI